MHFHRHITAQRSPEAQGKDFHMVMKIRTPPQRCLKKSQEPGEMLGSSLKKGKFSERETECFWLKVAAWG